jgi:hypothetical protein
MMECSCEVLPGGGIGKLCGAHAKLVEGERFRYLWALKIIRDLQLRFAPKSAWAVSKTIEHVEGSFSK